MGGAGCRSPSEKQQIKTFAKNHTYFLPFRIFVSGKNIHPLRLKKMSHSDLYAVFRPTFSLHFHHGRVERVLDYNPSSIKYTLLYNLELPLFLSGLQFSSL